MECADSAPTRKDARNCRTNHANRIADCRPTRNKMERARPKKERKINITFITAVIKAKQDSWVQDT